MPIRRCISLILAISAPFAARAQPVSPAQRESFEALRAADLKLAEIGWRLATANVAICDRQEPGTGLQLHSADQFEGAERAAAERHFAFATPVAIEGVVKGTPAAAAGLRQDDSLVRVGSVDVAALPGKPGTTQRLVAAQLALAALPPSQALTVDVRRSGAPVRVTVHPVPACRSRFELRVADDFGASADGTMVQISSAFLQDYSDAELAALIAHEFAHNVLRHRDRLEARGVTWGLLAGFGGNVKYFRQTEIEADLLSVYLLANAGYDPRASLAFWRRFGPSKAGGIFRSRTHPAWRDRIATLETEIARIDATPQRPLRPAIIVRRDQPLTGDWQALLIRAR